jgi:iron-regulated transporter 1
MGTYTFSFLHNTLKLKLTAVGLTGSVFQMTFLTLCLISIWLPGSPFELSSGRGLTCDNSSYFNQTSEILSNSTDVGHGPFMDHFFLSPCKSYYSILMLLFGMAFSRFGLWLFDLSIHQIIQENVAENERGVVGGVQSSINTAFDLIKFTIVIFLPTIPKYGYLAIVSYGAVFLGFVLFTIYTCIILFHRKYQQIPTMDPVLRSTNDTGELGTELQVTSH